MSGIYPDLSAAGKQEAQTLIDNFKAEMKKVVDNVLGDAYCDVAVNIESDSWTNYKNKLLSGLCDYKDKRDVDDYDFKRIRQAIFDEHKDEIIGDLNQDLIKKVEDLEAHIVFLDSVRANY